MKKILGILMALTMASSFSMTTMADDVVTETQIQPRAIPCDNCSSGTLWKDYRRGGVSVTHILDCPDYPFGRDEEITYEIFLVWECNSCGYESNRIFDHEEVIFVCKGRNDFISIQSE